MQAESTIPAHFLEKRYYSWNNHLREIFGEKVFKVAIDGGFIRPNPGGFFLFRPLDATFSRRRFPV